MRIIPLLFYLAIFYLIYKFIRSLITNSLKNDENKNHDRRFSRSEAKSDDLIQDPYCKVFFPKNDGYPLKLDGKTFQFCSEKCRDSFYLDNKND
ncbi:MAG: hypothetical protein GY714_02110 [Desulfobacterales bacterium]|nr:hypothetical protein [Desulfobacterales bacterium]MCP4160238.1 hypothetical protein [Deltaproteobacteria bacterium]